MLQIIGWMLCAYLVVKGCELLAMKQPAATVGAAIAFITAPIFFLLLHVQVAGDPALDAARYGTTAVDPDQPTQEDINALMNRLKE